MKTLTISDNCGNIIFIMAIDVVGDNFIHEVNIPVQTTIGSITLQDSMTYSTVVGAVAVNCETKTNHKTGDRLLRRLDK